MNMLPVRKPLRLQTFDYSSSGMYFLTVCTFEKQCLFSEVVGAIHESPASCTLTPYGLIVDALLHMIPLQLENAGVHEYIIMPNHVHMIVELSQTEELWAIHESPLRSDAVSKRSELSKIVGYFKMQVSKRIHELDPAVKVWQRGYYDHIIRDYEDYKTKAEYIATNPLRWLQHRSGEAL